MKYDHWRSSNICWKKMCKINWEHTKNNSYPLTDIFETLSAKGILDHAIIVSLDMVNMFPSTDNNSVIAAVKTESWLKNKFISLHKMHNRSTC